MTLCSKFDLVLLIPVAYEVLALNQAVVLDAATESLALRVLKIRFYAPTLHEILMPLTLPLCHLL